MKFQIGSASMSGRSSRVDLSRIPATHVERSPKALGIFLIVFSLFWGGIPAAILIISLATGQFGPEMLLLLIFAVIGAAIMLAGLRVMTHRRTLTIGPDEVSAESKSLFGRKSWREPLERYRGVLKRREHHSGGKNSASYTLHIVELYHDERKKRIRLHTSRSEEGLRGVWKDCARRLHVPALEKSGGELTVRNVEDLDKSVRELAGEGKLEFDFDPDRPPPEGFDLQVVEDGLCVGLPSQKATVFGIGFVMLFCAVFVYVGFFVDGAPLIFGIIGLLFFLLSAGGMVWTSLSRRMVTIGPEQIRLFHRTPWGDTGGKVLRTDDIDAVKIGKTAEGHGRDGVIIATEDSSVMLAQGLPAEKLQWLRNCVLAVIAG